MRDVFDQRHPTSMFGLPVRWAAAILGAALVLICLSFALLLWNARLAERQKAALSASNLSAALTQDIARTIQLYDLSIQSVLEGLADTAAMSSPPEVLHRVLFDRAATAPFLGSILVEDQRGDVLFDSASLVPRAWTR